MTRFYFDLHNDEVTIDEEGVEFADLDAARDCATREVRAIAAESVKEHSHLVRSHRIVIRDGDREVAAVTFGEVIAVRD